MRLTAAVLLAVLAGTAFAQKAHEVEILWVGRYKISETQKVADPMAPSGYHYTARGIELLESTRKVPAVIGTRFGVAYELKGGEPGTVVPVRAFWRFPPSGITNPETRTTTFEFRTAELQCRVGQKPFCLMGYPLQYEWELVPGRWSVEIWVDGVQTAEASFNLYRP